MEGLETIRRRDAIAGLGVLCVLGAALVATIVYRIVQAAPRSAPARATSAWAKERDAAPSATRPQSEKMHNAASKQLADGAPVSATSIPTAYNIIESEPTTTANDAAEEPPGTMHSTRQPHFVAPSHRHLDGAVR